MKRIHLWVEGRVQGVSYRYFVRTKAKEFKVNGWVKNLDDGRVEIVAEGPSDPIERFVKACKKGPVFAKVKEVEMKEEKPDEPLSTFEVRY